MRPWQVHAGGVCVLAAMSLIAFMAGVRPLLARWSAAAALKVAVDSRQQIAGDVERQEAALRDDLNRVRMALDASSLTLQTAAFRNERLARLTELAADHDLSVNGVLTTDVVRDERYDMVPIRIEGMGSFPDCVRFLHDLNGRFRDTGVRAFELRGSPGRHATDAFFRFEMVWYAAPSLASAEGGDRGMRR
jgi:Tfp pilus assembly protein PilO